MPSVDIIWVVDDDPSIRFVLRKALNATGFQVEVFENLKQARERLNRDQPDLLISDLRLPDGDGFELLEQFQSENRDIPVIIITAYSDLDQAVGAFQRGAFEYISKPFDLKKVIETVNLALVDRKSIAPQLDKTETDADRVIGEAPAMQEVFRTIGRLSCTDISVLLTGETGTGKELIALALHQHSPRADKPYVAINTAAIPVDLLESELFGHERGAFTGAVERRTGRFEQARGGTLFLDEIGDMPISLQTRLLRVLAEGDYYRVGGRDLLKADVRIIAATHQDMAAKVADGSFREDLYHRLNVIQIQLPPLRERRQDISAFCELFLSRYAKEMRLERKTITPEALRILESLRWPGNVRQLQNLCRQLCVMAPAERIYPQDLPAEICEGNKPSEQEISSTGWTNSLRDWAKQELLADRIGLLKSADRAMETELIRLALEQSNQQRKEAARLLGCSRNTLTRKIQQLNL
ncbi:MAG: nitrogen regulation protein NR(I) [Xanthomonadales bacterium]|nr:nitrogen regulation protein NR(I) [Xanthomonadales bacterium]